MIGLKWETDATRLSEKVDLNRFVFKNDIVDSFLRSSDGMKQFIIAGKGMGKTLLLHTRRKISEKSNGSVRIIPQEAHRSIDFVEAFRSDLPMEIQNLLSDFNFCKKFWVIALKLYILSDLGDYSEQILDYIDVQDRKKCSELFHRLFERKAVLSIGYVANALLDLNYATFKWVVNNLNVALIPSFDSIHTPIYAFLDRLDQSLDDSNMDMWITVQNALLVAAWDLTRYNSHIKIYVSIRKEAYVHLSNQTSDANAMHSSVVLIKYTKDDLKKMINQLVEYYEDKESIYEYFGFKRFYNTTINKLEDVFDFMYRYSVGRPRDFVQMCCDVAPAVERVKQRSGIEKQDVKLRIIKTASNCIEGLFSELKVLLTCFKSTDDLKRFVKLLERNVYTYQEMTDICKKYNLSSCDGDCKNCSENNHPFCDLYNMGLLGVLDTESGQSDIQKFKTPYEPMTRGLRKSEFYLLHPALREYIAHENTDYHLVKGILVGHDLPWEKDYADYFKLDILLDSIKNASARKYMYEKIDTYIEKSHLSNSQKKKLDKIKVRMEQERPDLWSSLSEKERIAIKLMEKYFDSKKIDLPASTKSVFISYASNGDTETEDLIDSFREQLCLSGFNAQHYKSLKIKYPDLNELMRVGIIESDKVIIVLSEEYKRKAAIKGSGVYREYMMMLDDMPEHDNKYILVCFDKYDKESLCPVELTGRWVVSDVNTRNKYNQLLAFLKDESEYYTKISNTVEPVTKVQPRGFFKD